MDQPENLVVGSIALQPGLDWLIRLTI